MVKIAEPLETWDSRNKAQEEQANILDEPLRSQYS